MNKLPTRKPNRLPGYDYSSVGAYFITICTKDRKAILSDVIVGTTIGRPPEVKLKNYGKIADRAINLISVHYANVFVDNYVIMPNHIHILLRIEHTAEPPPSVSRIIKQLKGYVTKKAGEPIWQEKSYDHIIRDKYDYLVRWQYIDDNPANWLLKKDEYY